MTVKIISRHKGAIEWIKSKGFDGEVTPHLSLDDVKEGDIVVGVLPTLLAIRLLHKAAEVILLELPELPLEERGKELTKEMMDKYGASLWKLGVSNSCGHWGGFGARLTGCNCCDCTCYVPDVKRV